MSDAGQCAIAGQLANLVADVGQRSVDLETALAEVVDSASRHVSGAQWAGITLVHEDSVVETIAATHRWAAVLDEIQQRTRTGPCLSAAWERHTVRIDDLTADTRWPAYAADVVAQTPVRSVLSFEMFVNHTVIGALNKLRWRGPWRAAFSSHRTPTSSWSTWRSGWSTRWTGRGSTERVPVQSSPTATTWTCTPAAVMRSS